MEKTSEQSTLQTNLAILPSGDPPRCSKSPHAKPIFLSISFFWFDIICQCSIFTLIHYFEFPVWSNNQEKILAFVDKKSWKKGFGIYIHVLEQRNDNARWTDHGQKPITDSQALPFPFFNLYFILHAILVFPRIWMIKASPKSFKPWIVFAPEARLVLVIQSFDKRKRNPWGKLGPMQNSQPSACFGKHLHRSVYSYLLADIREKGTKDQ